MLPDHAQVDGEAGQPASPVLSAQNFLQKSELKFRTFSFSGVLFDSGITRNSHGILDLDPFFTSFGLNSTPARALWDLLDPVESLQTFVSQTHPSR
jgi:hypothetical protein